jgi:hypothetical protein
MRARIGGDKEFAIDIVNRESQVAMFDVEGAAGRYFDGGAQSDPRSEVASIIGEGCSLKRVMTTALVLGLVSAPDEALSQSLAQLRTWALMLVVASAEEYIADMLAAVRA